MKKYQFIDNFKYIGAILVMLYHATGILGLPVGGGNIAYYIQKYGWLPVELFFWSSGYFMYKKYSEPIGSGELSLGKYLKKRLGGIYPIYLISLLISVVMRHFIYDDRAITLWDLIVNLSMLNTGVFYINGSEWRNDIGWATWYIGVLVVCYILFFFVNKLITDKDNKIFVYAVLIIIGINGMGIGNTVLYNFYVQRGIVGFFSGAMIALLFNDCIIKEKKRYLIYLICGVVSFLFVRTLYNQELGNARIISIFDCVLFPLLFTTIQNVGWLGRILNKPLFSKKAGALSSYIYFFHYPVLIIFFSCLKSMNMNTSNWFAYGGLIVCINIISVLCLLTDRKIHKSVKK